MKWPQRLPLTVDQQGHLQDDPRLATLLLHGISRYGTSGHALHLGIPCNVLLSLFNSIGQWCYTRKQLNGSVKEPNKFHIYRMKLRKSLIKPVTWQNISSCSVLSPEIVMHDAFNVILWTSANICVVVHDDLGWKNRTTRYILPCH